MAGGPGTSPQRRSIYSGDRPATFTEGPLLGAYLRAEARGGPWWARGNAKQGASVNVGAVRWDGGTPLTPRGPYVARRTPCLAALGPLPQLSVSLLGCWDQMVSRSTCQA